MTDISIVIPTRNRPEKLKRLVNYISNSTSPNVDIVIVNDGGIEMPKFDANRVTIITNSDNRGLAHSRTLGALKSKGKYILFIDDDNVVGSDMVEKLARSLDKYQDLLAVGPATYYFSDKEHLWFVGSKINLFTTLPTFYRTYDNDELINDELFVTDNLHNCFMVRRELGDKVNWFDEKVFMNGTEFDLFQRIKKLHPKYQIATNVQATCYHDVPQFKEDLLRSMGFENKKRVYYFQRNRGLHVSRYGNWMQKVSLIFIFYPLFCIGYLLLFLLKKRPDFALVHLKATRDGYRYLIGK